MLLSHSKGVLAKRFDEYLKKDKRLQKVVKAVRKDFDKSGLTAHNWEHIWRDTLNAIVIGEAEHADMSMVLPAILMHDIGFLYGATGKTHGAVGAQKISSFLKKHKITYPPELVRHMAECIRTHKGSMQGEKPVTLEAKVVCDADFLEKFGMFGVYQLIRTHTEFNSPIEPIIVRGKKTFSLETKTGRRLAEKGRKSVVKFFEQLDRANQSYCV